MKRDWMDIPRLHIADIELPREVRHLYDLAYNLWWTWHPRARDLFNAIDSRAWSIYRNPVQLLINFDRNHWQSRLDDESFLALYRRVTQAFDDYMGASPTPGSSATTPTPRAVRWPTSAWSSASTNRSPSTRAVSACSPGIT